MATYKENIEIFDEDNIIDFVKHQKNNLIIEEQQKQKAKLLLIKEQKSDIYTMTLGKEDWLELENDLQNNTPDDNVMKLLSMESIFS